MVFRKINVTESILISLDFKDAYIDNSYKYCMVSANIKNSEQIVS